MNFLRNMRFAPRIIWNHGKTPLYLIFFVTSRCNMRCRHCFFWKGINRQREFSLEEISKISRTMDDLLFLRLTGGEPFLREDISDIIGIFYRNNRLRNMGINTNGFFTEKIVKEASKIMSNYNILLDVCVSIDDLPEKNDKLRGTINAFNNARNTIIGLNKLKKTFPKLTTTIGMTVTAENQNRLDAILDEIKKINPDFISANLIRGSPKEISLKEVDIKNYLKIIDRIRSYNQKRMHNFYLNASLKDRVQSKIIADTHKQKKFQGLKCLASDKIAVLYPGGDVYPCELLDRKIGNLRDNSFDFRKLWKSKTRKNIKEQIHRKKCFCTHECFLSTNLLLSPRGWIRMLKDSMKPHSNETPVN